MNKNIKEVGRCMRKIHTLSVSTCRYTLVLYIRMDVLLFEIIGTSKNVHKVLR